MSPGSVPNEVFLEKKIVSDLLTKKSCCFFTSVAVQLAHNYENTISSSLIGLSFISESKYVIDCKKLTSAMSCL